MFDWVQNTPLEKKLSKVLSFLSFLFRAVLEMILKIVWDNIKSNVWTSAHFYKKSENIQTWIQMVDQGDWSPLKI